MSKETREHLSALVDGEISSETSRFLVRRLGTDHELRATWTRYHLVRDCLRHQEGAMAGDDLCDRISRVIENEQPAESGGSAFSRWLKPLTGTAIAASVALVAISAVGPGLVGTAIPTAEMADSEAAVEQFTSPQNVLSPAPASSQVSLSNGPGGNDRNMDAYLLRHYQASGATGGKGFVLYVPMVITGSKASAESEQPGAEDPSGSERTEESNSR